MTQATGTEIYVGSRAELEDGERRFVTVDGVEIGVLAHAGRIHAFENRCVHQGGPVCEGVVLGKVEAVLDAERRQLGERFSENELHLVCPWHGFEYDLESGECVADRRLRLRRFEVVEREGEVYVVA